MVSYGTRCLDTNLIASRGFSISGEDISMTLKIWIHVTALNNKKQ